MKKEQETQEKEQETQEKEQETQEKEQETQEVSIKEIDTEDLSEKVAQKIQQKINREKNEKAKKVIVETENKNVKDNPNTIILIFSSVFLAGVAIFSLLKLRKNSKTQQNELSGGNSVSNSSGNSSSNNSLIDSLIRG